MQLYYELGRDWQHVSSDTVPLNLLWQWMFESSEKVNFRSGGNVVIPIEELSQAVAKKFPGKWQGEFAFGARGVRFWDTEADNPTATVVRESGMQCFTGTQGFVFWAEIFGSAFVEKFKADRVGEVVKDWAYDGRNYWTKMRGNWEPSNREDFRLYLRTEKHLSVRMGGKENASEVDQVVHAVNQQKRVSAVLPRVYTPDDVYWVDKIPYLNTCTRRCIEPCTKTKLKWGAGFPWLAKFFKNYFDPPEQYAYFMAWLKRFYEKSYLLSPELGQTLFIGGAPGVGKTFLSTVVLSKMMGGSQDASSFVVEGNSRFSSHIFSVGVLTIDDAMANTSNSFHEKFTNWVKSLAANNKFSFEQKYGTPAQTEWSGRLIVTCNLDPNSTRILPSLTSSDADKICFFKANSSGAVFESNKKMNDIVDAELPFLCRWLLEWRVPKHVISTSRFGVKGYHDESMTQAARMSDVNNEFSELLDLWRVRWYCTNKPATMWTGTAAELFSQLVTQPDLEQLARPYTNVRGFGRRLSNLSSTQPEIVAALPSGRTRAWEINCHPDLLPEVLYDATKHKPRQADATLLPGAPLEA